MCKLLSFARTNSSTLKEANRIYSPQSCKNHNVWHLINIEEREDKTEKMNSLSDLESQVV